MERIKIKRLKNMAGPEFAGYQGQNRGNILDWNQIAGGLSGSIKSVDQARQTRRAENERIMKESERLLNETEQPKSQTLNQFILKGADQARSMLFEWNKQLKAGDLDPAEWKARNANLNEYWNSLATATKSLDQRLTQAMERQQVGADGTLPPASQIEAEMQMYFGGLANLKDKSLVIDGDGRVQIGKYDADGNLISTEDVKYINNPANVVFNRTDVGGMVAADVKNWGDWSIGRVSDVRQNPQFQKAKMRLTDAIIGTPRSAASVLVDNTDGDYQVYFNEQDKQDKLSQLKLMYSQMGQKVTDAELEKQLIAMKQDANGDYQPALTEDQVDAAREIVESEIELQLGRKVEPRPVVSGGNNGPTWDQMRRYQEDMDDNLRGYIAAREAWTNNDASGLRSGYNYKKGYDKKYISEDNPNGYFIEVQKEERDRKGATVYRTVKKAHSAEGLAEFAFNGDANQALSDYNQGRDVFYGQGIDKTDRFQKKANSGESDKPRVGQVVDGYKFLGGDPTNPKSWKKQ
jgi:hypothetical protein